MKIDLPAVVALAAGHPLPALLAGTVAVAVLVLVWRVASRAARRLVRGQSPEDALTLLAAVIATVVAMTGMWRFFGDVLGASGPLRVLTFAFIEIAVFTSALRARRNVRESVTHSAGVDGAAVWALTGLSAILAALDAGSVRGALLRLSAPMVAAWLWERSMAVERRRATGRAIHWRLTPERLLVRLGLAEASDRTASQVDAQRRLSRLARSAKRVRALRTSEAAGWRLRRAGRRLDAATAAAVEHAGLATEPARQDALLAQLGALYHSAALADLSPAATWDRPVPVRVVDQPGAAGALAAVPAGPVEQGADERPATVDQAPTETTAEAAPPALDDVPVAAPAGRVGDLDDARLVSDELGTPAAVLAPLPRELEPYVRRARRRFGEDLDRGNLPSVRRLKKSLHIGQKRAGQVKAYLLQSTGR
jgi:hypothetical protein